MWPINPVFILLILSKSQLKRDRPVFFPPAFVKVHSKYANASSAADADAATQNCDHARIDVALCRGPRSHESQGRFPRPNAHLAALPGRHGQHGRNRLLLAIPRPSKSKTPSTTAANYPQLSTLNSSQARSTTWSWSWINGTDHRPESPKQPSRTERRPLRLLLRTCSSGAYCRTA